MIDIELALNWRVIAAVLFGLFGYAWGYNALVDALHGSHDGDTAWLVVGGVTATLCGAALIIGILPVLIVAACFVASGIPMILGERIRHQRAQRKDAERLRQMFKDMGNGEA